ncbi:MAG: septum formation initiator family protein [Candidatus Aminicenantes bacterium]|nr:septum formation initiator family protein [Candidatus Aminicenantes bacterium]
MTSEDKGSKNRRDGRGGKRWLGAGLALLVVVFLITSLFGKKGFLEIRRARRAEQALLMEKQRLEEDKRRLEREIRELETDPRAVELEARDKLWLMRPDEIVIVDPKK